MTITTAQIESYRRSWFPPRADFQERAMLFWRALGRPALTASGYDERAELFRAVIGARPGEFRARTSSYQAEIGRALDGALARRTASAHAALRADLAAADRAQAARITAALDRRVAAADRVLLASLGTAAEAARMPRPPRLRLLDTRSSNRLGMF